MTENTTNSADLDPFPWSLKITRDTAMFVLGLNREQFFLLKLRRIKVGRTTFYDPDQVNALIYVKKHWQEQWEKKQTPR